jgi:hypothetical protein
VTRSHAGDFPVPSEVQRDFSVKPCALRGAGGDFSVKPCALRGSARFLCETLCPPWCRWRLLCETLCPLWCRWRFLCETLCPLWFSPVYPFAVTGDNPENPWIPAKDCPPPSDPARRNLAPPSALRETTRKKHERLLDFWAQGSSMEISPPIQFRIEWADSQGKSPLLGCRPI